MLTIKLLEAKERGEAPSSLLELQEALLIEYHTLSEADKQEYTEAFNSQKEQGQRFRRPTAHSRIQTVNSVYGNMERLVCQQNSSSISYCLPQL